MNNSNNSKSFSFFYKYKNFNKKRGNNQIMKISQGQEIKEKYGICLYCNYPEHCSEIEVEKLTKTSKSEEYEG